LYVLIEMFFVFDYDTKIYERVTQSKHLVLKECRKLKV